MHFCQRNTRRLIEFSGFDEVNEGCFCLVLVGEGSTGEKVIEVLEKMVIGWRDVWGVWRVRQNFDAQFVDDEFSDGDL